MSRRIVRRVPDASSIILAEDVTDKSEWPYAGFSRNLIGLSSGDEKTIETTLPEDYGDENLRDKPVVITVIVKEVKSRILPAIDDELAQGLGEYADLPARNCVRIFARRCNARKAICITGSTTNKSSMHSLKDPASSIPHK